MSLHRIEIGEKYDSGNDWHRNVEVDTATNELNIRIDGDVLMTSVDQINWIINALEEARHLLKIKPE